MIGQSESSFNFREAMDSRKIIIINLSKGKIGDENMKLLGGLLVTKIYLAAMSRADVPDRVMKVLPQFYLHVDEFQNFANASFADILSEARKYKLNLTIAHQYIEQMDEFVRPAVFGNVGTMIVFRVGATDAEAFEKEFAPQFTMEDLVNLGFAQVYLKLMIDGLSSTPFSATTLPPIAHPDVSYVKEIVQASREQFARSRASVEQTIAQFHEATPAPKKPAGAGTPIPPLSEIQATAKKTAPSIATSSMAKVQSVATPISSAVKVIPSTSTPPTPVAPASAPVSSAPAQSPKTFPTGTIVATTLADELSALITPVKKPVVPQPPITTPSSNAKPVSLSSLASKSHQTDPKSRSPQHVNDLKNALAAVLGKNKPVTEAPVTATPVQSNVSVRTHESKSTPRSVEKDQLKPDDGFQSLASLKNSTIPQNKTVPVEQKKSVPEQSAPATPREKNTPSYSATPEEVPEDVLKKVLNVD